ncbi:MAG: Pyridoxine 5'-phosphate synthase (EC [uncultured Sulfurovum sp.]|uniref:Pyridoxine 5'-phosphate synthase n=1 Tax=uncultured Sulfurovum sp. TaxID=269237 RepID=A0A6S6SZK4_9BACT|nr:MAG: Pyridoxine 5'-phosphate synthase (EC [uncultured Sulfurovum sp.]
MKLGVNIDHIAVLREARKVADPSPLDALSIVKRAGADQITIHLREDRRHIQDIDALNIIYHSSLPVNLECALAPEIIDIVCELQPHRVTLVPEKREEVTTEGGLDIFSNAEELTRTIRRLKQHEIEVSLFIDPTLDNVEMSEKFGVDWIEFHTGKYANVYAMYYGNLGNTHHSIKELELPRSELKEMLEEEVSNLRTLSCDAMELGLKVAAGHGLNYQNVKEIADIETIEELNIGQSIIARSVFTGLEQAVIEMKILLEK